MDQISFPFMRLPTELQAGIVYYVRRNSDLQALCLVSKHVSDIATPRLYYEVNLIRKDISSKGLEEKIDILLIKPANLHFVQVSTTDDMTQERSLLMDRLLPQLQKDFLREINFTSFIWEGFPLPHQMEFLWYNQKNLRNLRFMDHMVPWLEKFLKGLQSGRSAILKFFTELEIAASPSIKQRTQIMLWPLKNLDLNVLQKLAFTSRFIGYSIFSTLNTLIANRCFVNLTELRFCYIRNLDQPVILTQMPSLKLLKVYDCKCQEPGLSLELTDDIRLSYLIYVIDYDVEKIIPLLTQAIGLEYLSL